MRRKRDLSDFETDYLGNVHTDSFSTADFSLAADDLSPLSSSYDSAAIDDKGSFNMIEHLLALDDPTSANDDLLSHSEDGRALNPDLMSYDDADADTSPFSSDDDGIPDPQDEDDDGNDDDSDGEGVSGLDDDDTDDEEDGESSLDDDDDDDDDNINDNDINDDEGDVVNSLDNDDDDDDEQGDGAPNTDEDDGDDVDDQGDGETSLDDDDDDDSAVIGKQSLGKTSALMPSFFVYNVDSYSSRTTWFGSRDLRSFP